LDEASWLRVDDWMKRVGSGLMIGWSELAQGWWLDEASWLRVDGWMKRVGSGLVLH